MASYKQKHSLYSKIKDQILDSIKDGRFGTGDKMPSENELCERFEVSRTTIRLALQQLELEGYISKVQGKGTFVNKKIVHRVLAPMQSFTELMIGQGLNPKTKVLEFTVIAADARLAEKLQIKTSAPVIRLVRLRHAGEEPIHYDVTCIPWECAPGLTAEECSGSLFRLLEGRFHIRIERSVETLEPVTASFDIAKHLHIREGTPCFQVTTLSYAGEQSIIEYTCSVIRQDYSNFIIERRYSSAAD